MNSDPPVRAPPVPDEVDPNDVEEDFDEEPEDLAEEKTNPSHPLDVIAQAVAEDPDAIDAMLDGLRQPSFPPPAPSISIPPVLDPRLVVENEDDPNEDEFYSRVTGVPAPPKLK